MSWWQRFIAWLRPLPQIVQVPQAPITVHVEPPEPVPFTRGLCQDCCFWEQKDKSMGLCRAHAPVHADLSSLGRPTAFWALTAGTSWCGDFRRV